MVIVLLEATECIVGDGDGVEVTSALKQGQRESNCRILPQGPGTNDLNSLGLHFCPQRAWGSQGTCLGSCLM